MSLRVFQTLDTSTAVYNSMCQDFTNLERCNSDNNLVLHLHRTTVLTLQSNLHGMCTCRYLIGHHSALLDTSHYGKKAEPGLTLCFLWELSFGTPTLQCSGITEIKANFF